MMRYALTVMLDGFKRLVFDGKSSCVENLMARIMRNGSSE